MSGIGMNRNTNTELLLIYLREDGLFARFLPTEAEPADVSVRDDVTEDSLRRLLDALLRRADAKAPLMEHHVTVAFSLSRKVEVLKPYVFELLRGYSFADSVSALPRDELFCRAAMVLSEEGPKQVLYCDTRETRLFTSDGEIPLHSGRGGGNGFLDWLLGFVENEEDSFSYYLEQYPRLCALFGVYRCFSRAETPPVGRAGFPKRGTQPFLEKKPVRRAKRGRRAQASVAEETAASASVLPVGERIDYTALSPSDRAKVDRRYPALYRAVRTRRKGASEISIGRAAETFGVLFGKIRKAPLSDLVVVGAYGKFPLTADLLASLPQKPAVSYESESKLLLDGMEQAVKERIVTSRLSLKDVDGDEILLWDDDGSGDCPEKRVSFAVTLKRCVSREEWKRRTPLMPYTVELTELRPDDSGAFRRVRVAKSGDLREFCYKKGKDGSYRLRLPETAPTDSAFRTVRIGIGATPVGVTCRLLRETAEEAATQE